MDIVNYLGLPAILFIGFVIFCLAKGGKNTDQNNGGGNSTKSTSSTPSSNGGNNESQG